MVGHLIGLEVRAGWRGILLLSLVVALVVGTVLAAVAGAHRSRTAFDRYLERVNPPDMMAFGEPADLAALDIIPEVESSVPFEVAAVFPAADGYYPMLVAGDDRIFRDILRYRVVSGRLPDPTAPFEVALSERTAQSLQVAPGDTLAMESMTPSGAAALAASEDGFEADGPTFALDVVGVVRDLGDLGSRASDITITLLTPAFRDHFGAEDIGSDGTGRFVTLAAGAGVASLSDVASAHAIQIDTGLGTEVVRDQVDPTMRAIATALQVFAGVAALAGLATIAHTASRTQQAAATDDRTLAALGVARSARFARLAGPGLVAIFVGTPVGVAAAVVASRWFPVGLARRAEPDLGMHFDARALVVGAVAAALIGVALISALAVLAARTHGGVVRSSRLARTAAGAGAPPAVVTGLTFATSAAGGHGSSARAAVVGTAAGVLGVVAATVFTTNIDQLVRDPQRYGWGWDANIAGAELSGLPGDAVDADGLLADADLDAVAEVVFQLDATLDRNPGSIMVVSDLKGHMAPVVIEGTEPTSVDEIALGDASLQRLGKRIGDDVAVDVGDGPRSMRITAVIALPVSDDGGSSAAGGYVTSAAGDALGFDGRCDEDENCYRNAAVRLAPGVALSEVVARYEDLDAGIAVDVPRPPGEVERLVAVEQLPRYLAAFLALLAVTAIAYAAGTTVRRRRTDLAVLRVLGMSTRQMRSVVTVQVLALTAVGALVGTALGVVVGRQVWRVIVDSIPLPFAPALPVQSLVLVPLATLAVAQLAGSFARRSAGRTPTAVALRAE